MVNIIEHIIDF